jgi:trans-aconitate 2-methyltransferase
VSWSARQYAAFEDERTRPARDLLAGVPLRDVSSAVDLGCGPGNSTELIAARFPRACIVGIDASADMIAAARARLPALRFEVADVRTWAGGAAAASSGDAPDLIFANAVLQWLPDHAGLFPRLAAKLAPGGCLALQMPDNLGEPAQILMREIAEQSPWRHKLAGARESRVQIEPAEWYYRLLRAGTSRVDVWRTTYYHRLAGAGAIVEWFKGTGLLPFLAPLDAAERAEYLSRYTQAIGSAYPAAPDGGVLLPFPRLFIVAHAIPARYS